MARPDRPGLPVSFPVGRPSPKRSGRPDADRSSRCMPTSPAPTAPGRDRNPDLSAAFRAGAGWPAVRQPTRLIGGQCHRASMTSGRGRYMRSATYQMPCCGVGSQLDSRSGPGESGCR